MKGKEEKSEKRELQEVESLPEIPKNKVGTILQELEIMALQKRGQSSSGVDLSKFNPEQIDRLLGALEKNEDNAFKFHSKRLEVAKEIEIKRIESTTVNQKTIRIALVVTIIVVPLVTLAILFFKDEFFIPWLTFLTGLLGGVGLTKGARLLKNEPPRNPIIEEETDD